MFFFEKAKINFTNLNKNISKHKICYKNVKYMPKSKTAEDKPPKHQEIN